MHACVHASLFSRDTKRRKDGPLPPQPHAKKPHPQHPHLAALPLQQSHVHARYNALLKPGTSVILIKKVFLARPGENTTLTSRWVVGVHSSICRVPREMPGSSDARKRRGGRASWVPCFHLSLSACLAVRYLWHGMGDLLKRREQKRPAAGLNQKSPLHRKTGNETDRIPTPMVRRALQGERSERRHAHTHTHTNSHPVAGCTQFRVSIFHCKKEYIWKWNK